MTFTAEQLETQRKFMEATKPEPRPAPPQADVLLIDLSSLYWANWHATADQELSEAFKRTVDAVHRYAEGYEHVAVCCDAPPYKRAELLPEYKANRVAAPPLAREQLARVKDRLRADGFLLWHADGFEADDLLRAASTQALSAGHTVRVVSSDKDLHQLVCDGVTVQSPMSGTVYDEAGVIAKHGVPPEMMVDYLAMCGDKSDNVPGVPGVGPVTAAALLKHYGSLGAILDAAANDDPAMKKPKIKQALKDHAAAARLAAKVIALRIDAPVDWKEIYMERKPAQLVETKGDDMDDEEATGGNGHHAAEVVDLPPVKPAVAPPAPQAASALAVREDWSLALEPRSAKGAWALAEALHNSRLYQQYGSPEAIYAVLLRGRSLGMDATTALAAFHNIGGKITMHADLIAALVLRSGKAEYFEMVERSARKSVWATKRIGSRREQVVSFTIEDAAAAQLVITDPAGQDGYSGRDKAGAPSAGANWSKYRALMLDHRAKTQLARMVYPDVVMGLYSPDEIDAEATVIEARVA